jgi:hypothetical protein
VQGYLSNPINAYLLVKRLTTDWKEVEAQMVDDAGKGITHQYTSFELSITNNSVMQTKGTLHQHSLFEQRVTKIL